MSLATLPAAELGARDGPAVGALTMVLTVREGQKVGNSKKCYTLPNTSLCKKDKQLRDVTHTAVGGMDCPWVLFVP